MENSHLQPEEKIIWTEIERKQLFSKFSRGIDDVAFKLPNNQVQHYFIKNEPDTVCTLAFTQDNQVILAQQFRPGPQRVLLTLPGGGVTVDQGPAASAARELMEETGYLGQLKLVATFYSDGYSTSKRYCFLATNCTLTAAPKPDPTEFINKVLLPINIFIEKLRNGSITEPEAAFAAIDHILKYSDTQKEFHELGKLFRELMY